MMTMDDRDSDSQWLDAFLFLSFICCRWRLTSCLFLRLSCERYVPPDNIRQETRKAWVHLHFLADTAHSRWTLTSTTTQYTSTCAPRGLICRILLIYLVTSLYYHDYLQTKLRLSEAQQSLTLIAHKHNFSLSAIDQYKKDIQAVASSKLMGHALLYLYVLLHKSAPI